MDDDLANELDGEQTRVALPDGRTTYARRLCCPCKLVRGMCEGRRTGSALRCSLC